MKKVGVCCVETSKTAAIKNTRKSCSKDAQKDSQKSGVYFEVRHVHIEVRRNVGSDAKTKVEGSRVEDARATLSTRI